jgi:outer membrane receptor for ferrienterochelin and colicins
MNNITLGTRLFHRFGYRSKLSVDYFAIREERDGGNRHEFPLHERDVAEAVKHNMNNAALTYEQYFRKYDLLSIYSSAQFLDRNSYYGANKSLSDYGASRDRTYNTGIQYKAAFNGSSVIAGIENTGGLLKDQKLGYPDFSAAIIENDSIKSIPHIGNTVIANQFSITTGVFIQYEIKLNHTKVALGGRFDHYQINDLAKEGNEEKSGDVFSPRISIMQEISDQLQARIGYSKGFRAPQIFDEDLHIETSGSRQVINVNDPGLKQENSNSFNASLDFNGLIGTVYTGFLVDGFFTRLYDPFVNEIGEPDEEGTVIYTRVNAADGATVSGINMEFKLNPLRIMTLTSGFTLQRSRYDAEQEFNEKRFFRTPDQYGYMALDFNFENRMGLSATTNYTGKMLVPYFGPDADPNLGELRQSEEFLDLGLKIKQTVKLNGSNIQWFLGMKNIFNSYQNDFDKGIDRDPAYMYGPVSPRTLYFGIKFGNFLD